MAGRNFAHANNPAFACDADVIILPFGRASYLREIVERWEAEPVALDETTDRLAFRLRPDAAEITLVYSGMGAPAMANALEMIAANGARRVIVFGACGGVDPDVKVGDLIVASAAVRGEGTSRYYAPDPYPAVFDSALTAALCRTGVARRATVHCGVVYTTDAGYRQGPEVYEDHDGLVIGVENECAAAAVVSARLGLTAGALLFCTDNVTRTAPDDHGYKGLARPEVRRGFDLGFETVVATLSP